jgi:hypothetical protein
LRPDPFDELLENLRKYAEENPPEDEDIFDDDDWYWEGLEEED